MRAKAIELSIIPCGIIYSHWRISKENMESEDPDKDWTGGAYPSTRFIHPYAFLMHSARTGPAVTHVGDGVYPM